MWNAWILFGQQRRLLKIIIVDIPCVYGTKILKNGDRLFRNWFLSCHLDQGYCLPASLPSSALVSKVLKTLYTGVSWDREKTHMMRCGHLAPSASLNH